MERLNNILASSEPTGVAERNFLRCDELRAAGFKIGYEGQRQNACQCQSSHDYLVLPTPNLAVPSSTRPGISIKRPSDSIATRRRRLLPVSEEPIDLSCQAIAVSHLWRVTC